MRNFTFQTTKSILCEAGSSLKIGGLLKDMQVSRVMVVTDPGLMQFGLLDKGLESMESAGLKPLIFSDVVADPPEQIVLGAVEQAKAAGCDGVVGFGGGSSMDVAKLVAFLCKSEQQLSEIYGIGFCKGDRLPLIQVPTTAGTGSEVTPISILTTGASEKKGVVSPQLLPDWAVLDAELTTGLPKHITAATGIDAMVHALEAYTGAHKKNPLSDALAREALLHMGKNLRVACEDGGNVDARQAMLYGACLAGIAFANSPVAAVHALAYPIGGHFHVPHGLSNSLMLPHVMRFNAPKAAPLYAELAPLMAPGMSLDGTDEVVTDRLIDYIAQLSRDIELKTRLTEVGITENDVPLLASDAMKQERLLINNPREVTLEDAAMMYSQAL